MVSETKTQSMDFSESVCYQLKLLVLKLVIC